MENIYVYPKNKLINIEKQYLKYKLELLTDDFPESGADLKNKINFSGSQDAYDELLSSVSLDKHLDGACDFLVIKFHPNRKEKLKRKSYLQIPENAFNLESLTEIMKYREMQKGKTMKYGSPFGASAYNYKFIDEDLSPPKPNEILLQPRSDVIISIRFYMPFAYNQGTTAYGPRFSEEFLVLGSQSLTDLRDKITCISNNRRLFDISENPNTNEETSPTCADPGFFFITDTFYNDTRKFKNPDYSDVIINWAKRNKKFDINGLKKADMQNTSFFDLNVRLGFPQVYQHHGNCEHLFTFSSIQMISPDDNLQKSKYPILKTLALSNITTCNMCGTREYSVIVTNCKRQMHDPCHLCSECFENFHYVNGKKIGDFKAYQVNPIKPHLETEIEDEDTD